MQPYLVPYFTDNDRMTKILAFLPELDSLYKEHAEKNHFPGYAYGVVIDGELVKSGQGGFADLDKKIPITSQSVFRIASMTKSFIAMAILKLRDENRLKLDHPVHLYIPEMKNQKPTEDAPDITIRDLLIHSAGFPTDDPWADRKLDETEESFLSLIKNGFCFSNVPGTHYEYSNLGYTLLGYLINKVTGMHFEIFISEKIFQPLGMHAAAWDFTKVPSTQIVQGYRQTHDKWDEEKLLQNGIFGAMGGLMTSIEAFSRYVAFHQSVWPSRNGPETGPLKRSSVREMHQPGKIKDLVVHKDSLGQDHAMIHAYGYGLYWLCDQQKRIFIGHSGGLPGFGSNWFMMPEYGLAVIFFANVTYAKTAEVNKEVLEKLITAAELTPRQLPPSTILKERQKALMKLLPEWKNGVENGIFAANFFLDSSLDSLRKETLDKFAKMGKIISITEIIPENQLCGYFIIKGEKCNLHISFALTPENPPLIQQFRLKVVEKK